MPAKHENEEFDIGNVKIILRFVNKQFSRYTLFIPLFKFSKVFLRLEEKFSQYLKLKYKPRCYEVAKIANCVTSLICCGIDRFVRMDNEFRVEKGLAKSLGFPHGFFSSRTAYRFFESFNGYNIRQLERINLAVLREQKEHWYSSTGSVFIDLDMNTKSVEGKKIQQAALGYNRKHPGRLSLNWTVGHIAKIALFSELHSGKTSGRKTLKKQVERLEKLLRKLDINPKESRFVFRVDGGYFSWNNLSFLNKRKFITRLPKNLKVLKPFIKKKNEKKLKWRKYSNWSEYVDLGIVYFPDIDLDLRLLFVRVHRRRKILLYVLCANLFEWKAKSIVKSYRGRQIVENCFRDTNQAFYSNKLPSSSFHGNQAFLWFICFAYNLFFFFQRSDRKQKTKQNDTKKNKSKLSKKSRRAKIPKKTDVFGYF